MCIIVYSRLYYTSFGHKQSKAIWRNYRLLSNTMFIWKTSKDIHIHRYKFHCWLKYLCLEINDNEILLTFRIMGKTWQKKLYKSFMMWKIMKCSFCVPLSKYKVVLFYAIKLVKCVFLSKNRSSFTNKTKQN